MKQLRFLQTAYNIGDSDLDRLNRRLKSTSFGKGEFITVPGRVQTEMYLVKSGVQMSYFDSGAKTHVMAFTYPPGFCAVPESFAFQKPSRFFLTCLTYSEMEYITFEELQELFDESQEIERLFRVMTEQLVDGLITRHLELHSKTMEERYRSFCKRSPHLLQMVPHKYIASYLGIDPTNFSKLYNSIRI